MFDVLSLISLTPPPKQAIIASRGMFISAPAYLNISSATLEQGGTPCDASLDIRKVETPVEDFHFLHAD